MSELRSCHHCGSPVTRRGTRGRFPKWCVQCKSNPEVVRADQQRRHNERVAAAKLRVDNLMRQLGKAKGNP